MNIGFINFSGGSSSLNAALITLFPSIQPVGDIINSISTSENRDASIADRIENRKWCLLISSADFNIDVLPELRDLYSEAISDCYPALFETGVTQMPVLTGMSVKAQVRDAGIVYFEIVIKFHWNPVEKFSSFFLVQLE